MRGALRQSCAATCWPGQQPGQTRSQARSFAEKPLCFRRINPRYSLVQKYFYSVPFSSNLAPVFLSVIVAAVQEHVTVRFYSNLSLFYLQECHYILIHA